MKNIALLISLAVAVALVFPSCSGKPSKPTEQADSTKITYACPMKCEENKTYDKPGQCPVCGMDLEKVEAKTGTK